VGTENTDPSRIIPIDITSTSSCSYVDSDSDGDVSSSDTGNWLNNVAVVGAVDQLEGFTFDATGDYLYAIGEADMFGKYRTNTFTTQHTFAGLSDGDYVVKSSFVDSNGIVSSSTDRAFSVSVTDAIAPVISSVASTTSYATATVAWTTDESADSKVSYGTVSGTYTTSTSSATMTTSHSLGLTGLSASTRYYYVVVSKDASDNIATSSEYSLLTTAAPDTTAPVISSVATSTGATTATITWTTNENASSTVNYGATVSYGSASTSVTLTTAHSITLTGLTAATTYHFNVGGADAAGNISTSTDYTFTTTAAPDTTAPVISSVATSSTDSTVAISFVTDEPATSAVQFGTTVSYGSTVNIAPATTTHNVSFTGLSYGTTYHFKITATDAQSNVSSTTDATVITAPDTTAPSISSVSSSAVGTSSATITWTTNEAASSQVGLGLSTSYGSSTAVFDTSSRVTSHTVTLRGLNVCSSYEYRVGGADAAGNTSTSTNNSFITDGCVGDAEVIAHDTDNVTAASGGVIELTDGDQTIELDIPVNFSSVDAVFQIKKVDGATVVSSIGGVSGKEVAENLIYDLQAYEDDGTNITVFDHPINITLSYSNDDVRDILESSLVIYRYNGTEWRPLSNCVVDTGANTVTCETDHFSKFGLFGDTISSSSSGRRRSSSRYFAVLTNPVVSYPVSSTQVASLYIFARDLELLSTGDDVKELQKFLNAHGYTVALSGPGSVGSETTKFGDATKAALIRYQAVQGITPASGYFGPKTRALVNGNLVVVNMPATTIVQPVTTTATVTTKRVLQLGDIGDDVKVLQKFLNTHGYTVAASGPGSVGNETSRFGDATKAALIRFQEAYADRILTPQGLTKGTGMYGPATQKVVAEIESKL
jgi:hypothetical protein